MTSYALVCFGGAGGQTGCRVADSLGMKTVVLHPFSGILSAYGMGLADIRADRQQSVVKRLEDSLIPELESLSDKLAAITEEELERQSVPADKRQTRTILHLRYEGSDTPLPIHFDTVEAMREGFEQAHKAQFGFFYADKAIVAETLEVETFGGGAGLIEPDLTLHSDKPEQASSAKIYAEGDWHESFHLQTRSPQAGHGCNGGRPLSSNPMQPLW